MVFAAVSCNDPSERTHNVDASAWNPASFVKNISSKRRAMGNRLEGLSLGSAVVAIEKPCSLLSRVHSV